MPSNNRIICDIAFLGLRGIPSNYGGYETFVEEISTRLVSEGFKITVYCRTGFVQRGIKSYKGVKLVTFPTISHKYFHSVFHTLVSTFHVIFSNCKIIYYCDTINAVFAFFPRLFGKITIINVDGLEWKRKKWGKLGKYAYKISEWLATFLASEIICDSKEMKRYYLTKFNKVTNYISYGANGRRIENIDLLYSKYGLEPRKYFLYVSRLEPENNAHIFIKAYESIQTELPFIIVGDAPYAKTYIDNLRSTKDKRIIFLGYVFGDDYRLLTSHSFIYFHGNEVGGTNPGLVEAMALGNCIIATAVPFNIEVLGNSGYFFRNSCVDNLKKLIQRLMSNPDMIDRARETSSIRAKNDYSWNKVTIQYVNLFKKLLN